MIGILISAKEGCFVKRASNGVDLSKFYSSHDFETLFPVAIRAHVFFEIVVQIAAAEKSEPTKLQRVNFITNVTAWLEQDLQKPEPRWRMSRAQVVAQLGLKPRKRKEPRPSDDKEQKNPESSPLPPRIPNLELY